jgi:triacylglycerol lipase
MSALAITGVVVGGLFVTSILALLLCVAFHTQTRQVPKPMHGRARGEALNALLVAPPDPGYDDAKALACARVATLAYERDEAEVRAHARSWGWSDVRLIESKHHDGVVHAATVLRRGDVVVVGFRGTEDWDDWKANLKVWGVRPYPDWGSVHRGWWFTLEKLWPELEAVLGEPERSNVWLTGHSLGGALALLAAARRLRDGGEVAGVYTFGQPPVAKFDLVRQNSGGLASGYFRLISSVDAVADEDLSGKHCGMARYFDPAGRLFDRGPSFCQHQIDLFVAKWGEISHRGNHAETSAHHRTKYVDLLAETSAHQMTKYVQLLEGRLGLADTQSTM